MDRMKVNKKKGKLTALFLAVILILGMTPTTVFAEEAEHSITVINGQVVSAGGEEVTAAKEGTRVVLKANQAENGKEFAGWNVVRGNAAIDDPNDMETTFTVPGEDVEIEALYRDMFIVRFERFYTVQIAETTNGTVTANKTEEIADGEEITLTVTPDPGYELDELIVEDVDGNIVPATADNKFTMPKNDVKVSATFVRAATKYNITVVNGVASLTENGQKILSAKAETDVTLTADPAPSRKQFSKWKVKRGDVTLDDESSETTRFLMPAEDVEIEAVYKPIIHNISYDLNGGTLDGKTGIIDIAAEEGEVIKLPKAPTREGYRFTYWKGSNYQPGDSYTVEGNHTFTAQWEKLTSNENKADNKKVPGTGDDSNIFVWIAIIVASAAGIAGVAIAVKKKNNRR